MGVSSAGHLAAGAWIAIAGCNTGGQSGASAPDAGAAAAASSAADARPVAAAPGPECSLRSKALDFVAWSPDGRILLTGGQTDVEQSPDGKEIEDGSIDAWDLVRGARVFTLHLGTQKASPGPRVYVGFAPDGQSALAIDGSHGGPNPIARWDLASGSTRFAATTILYPEGVDISQDGKLAVIDGGGSNAVVVELPSMKLLHTTHNDTAASGSMLFSKDAASIVNDWQGAISLDAPRSLKTKKKFDAAVGALSPDRTALAIAGKGFWGIVDASTGKTNQAFESSPKTNDPVGLSISYSPDGKRVAVYHGVDERLFVWSAETGKRIGDVRSQGGTFTWTSDSSVLIVDRSPFDVTTMKASPTLPEGEILPLAGHSVILDTGERAIEIDASTGERTGRSWDLGDRVKEAGVVSSPDRSHMAFARKTGTVRIVRLSDGKSLDLGVVWVGAAQRSFAVAADGAFEGEEGTLGCAAKAAGRAVAASPGLVRGLFRR